MTLEILVVSWDRHKNVAGLNWLKGSQLSLLIITKSLTATHINKQYKTCTDSLSLKKTTYTFIDPAIVLSM
jgi:hypothetical protein